MSERSTRRTGRASSERRAQIREAALSLFSERGFHGTGMEHIAANVGLSPSSLYNHWDSKQDLLEDIMIATMTDLISGFKLATEYSPTPSAALSAAMRAHVEYHAIHHRDARIGNREIASLDDRARERVKKMRSAYANSWKDMIERGIVAGDFARVSSQLAAFALLEMGIGVSQWYRVSGPWSLDRIAGEYGEMALRLVGSKELV